MADQDQRMTAATPLWNCPGDTNSADIVGPTGEEMPSRATTASSRTNASAARARRMRTRTRCEPTMTIRADVSPTDRITLWEAIAL